MIDEENKDGEGENCENCDNSADCDNCADFRSCPYCSGRKKERSPEERKSLINRLNRIAGQINGIRTMVENNAYCPDILIQVSAATAALNSFNKELLAEHIRTCVADNIKKGNYEVVDELVETLRKMMK